MANKQIVWSSKAKNQFKKVLEFYNERNGKTNYSFKLLSEVEKLTKTLSKSEFIGRLTSNKKTRVIPMKVYLIFYEINNNNIEILSFWDNRQNEKNRNSNI